MFYKHYHLFFYNTSVLLYFAPMGRTVWVVLSICCSDGGFREYPFFQCEIKKCSEERVFRACSLDDKNFLSGELQADADDMLEFFNWK